MRSTSVAIQRPRSTPGTLEAWRRLRSLGSEPPSSAQIQRYAAAATPPSAAIVGTLTTGSISSSSEPTGRDAQRPLSVTSARLALTSASWFDAGHQPVHFAPPDSAKCCA
jgi:hypothetical protein